MCQKVMLLRLMTHFVFAQIWNQPAKPRSARSGRRYSGEVGEQACSDGEQRNHGHRHQVRSALAMVLDCGLPDGEALSMIRHLRARKAWFPILVLAAREGTHDRVKALGAGPTTVSQKPFATDRPAGSAAKTRPGPAAAILEVNSDDHYKFIERAFFYGVIRQGWCEKESRRKRWNREKS
jgi:CheY-like chemotaxis protein